MVCRIIVSAGAKGGWTVDVVEGWAAGLAEGRRGVAVELALRVSDVDSRLAAAVRWGRLTFAVDGDWHHWVCAVAVSGAGVRLVFHKGVLLADPSCLLTGSGRYVRELALADADDAAVAAFVREAVERRTEVLA